MSSDKPRFAFNKEVDRDQATPEPEQPEQSPTKAPAPQLSPMGNSMAKRFSFAERAQGEDAEQEIDLDSDEWVIEFTPEEAEEPTQDLSPKRSFGREL